MFLGRKKQGDAWQKQQHEDRHAPRMRIKTICRVTAADRQAFCKLSDLSLTGASIEVPWDLTGETRTMLFLNPPDDAVVHAAFPAPTAAAEFEVVRVTHKESGYQTGIRFREPTESFLRAVRAWFDYFGESPEMGPRPGHT